MAAYVAVDKLRIAGERLPTFISTRDGLVRRGNW